MQTSGVSRGRPTLQWRLQCFEQFRQLNKFVQVNDGQHLASNGCNLVPEKRVEVSAGFGDDDML